MQDTAITVWADLCYRMWHAVGEDNRLYLLDVLHELVEKDDLHQWSPHFPVEHKLKEYIFLVESATNAAKKRNNKKAKKAASTLKGQVTEKAKELANEDELWVASEDTGTS